MKIEYTLLLLFLIALSNITYGGIKTIEGKVLDNKQQALQYVSIGIINKTYGTISNESGYFKIQINENRIAISKEKMKKNGAKIKAAYNKEISNLEETNKEMADKAIQNLKKTYE